MGDDRSRITILTILVVVSFIFVILGFVGIYSVILYRSYLPLWSDDHWKDTTCFTICGWQVHGTAYCRRRAMYEVFSKACEMAMKEKLSPAEFEGIVKHALTNNDIDTYAENAELVARDINKAFPEELARVRSVRQMRSFAWFFVPALFCFLSSGVYAKRQTPHLYARVIKGLDDWLERQRQKKQSEPAPSPGKPIAVQRQEQLDTLDHRIAVRERERILANLEKEIARILGAGETRSLIEILELEYEDLEKLDKWQKNTRKAALQDQSLSADEADEALQRIETAYLKAKEYMRSQHK